VSKGTLATITLIPTLRDRIVEAQKNNAGMEKIRQRLMENDSKVACFHQDGDSVLWFKNRLVVPKNLELRK
jgi:hypothetical protein